MLLTALPPAPPTPITVIRGDRSGAVEGTLRLSVISASSRLGLYEIPSRTIRLLLFRCGRNGRRPLKSVLAANARGGRPGRLPPAPPEPVRRAPPPPP